jgi:hypothetical protein
MKLETSLACVALSAFVALACSGQHDLAAVLVGELDDTRDASSGIDGEPPGSFELLGLPAASERPSFEVAAWPLATSLRTFFGGDSPGARRVAVQGNDRGPLWQLRQAVAIGAYGPSRDTVLVQDASGDRYFVVFTGE